MWSKTVNVNQLDSSIVPQVSNSITQLHTFWFPLAKLVWLDMKETATSSWPRTVSLAIGLLICLTIVLPAEGQMGIVSILNLQYPSQAALQNGVAQVPVAFTLYYNYYSNPQGYLVFGIYASGTSGPVDGSATSTPDPCQSLTGTPYANAAICAIVPPARAGSESAAATLILTQAQQYSLSVVAFVWDSRNLQSGNRVAGSIYTTHFTITVTGQTASTISTTPNRTQTVTATNSSTPTAAAETTQSSRLNVISNVSETAVTSSAAQAASSPIGTLSQTDLLLTGAIVVLATLLAVAVLRRPRQGGRAAGRDVRVIYCRRCGTQSSTANQFCKSCGAKLQP